LSVAVVSADFGEGSGVGAGIIAGRKSFNVPANFVASSAEANSIAMSVCGACLALTVGQAATSKREVITSSECAFSHFTTVLNSFGGPESFRMGSSRSVRALDRMTCPAPLTSPYIVYESAGTKVSNVGGGVGAGVARGGGFGVGRFCWAITGVVRASRSSNIGAAVRLITFMGVCLLLSKKPSSD